MIFKVDAQTQKEKYAASLYERFYYLEASAVYSEIADKEIKKNQMNRDNMLKAAYSCYYSRKYSEASKYFGVANNLVLLSGSDLNAYIDCLLREKDYPGLNNLSTQFPEIKDPNGTSLNEIEQIHKGWNEMAGMYELKAFENNSGEGDYAAVDHNGTTFFSSSRKGLGYTHEAYEWDGFNYTNLFMIDTTGKIGVVESAQSELHDGPICFSPDGKKAYLTRTEYIKKGKRKIKHVKLYISNYTSSGFNAWVPFEYNGEDYNLGHATLSANGETIYFASDMPGGHGGTDIWKCELTAGKWCKPINLGSEVNTNQDELFPFIDPKENLYYSSNGFFGFGGLDVYVFNLGSDQKPNNVGPGLNSSMDDFAFYAYENGAVGYLSSDREGAVDRIYKVTIKAIKGTLVVHPKNVFKSAPLSDVDIVLIDRASNDTTIVDLDPNGNYSIPIENNRDYIISGSKKDFELDAPVYLNTDHLSLNETIEKDLFFNQTHYDIKVITLIKSTKEICPNVTGSFIDPGTREEINFHTDSNGVAMVNIENYHDYEVTAKKKGFLDLEMLVHTDASVLVELDLEMMEIKKDLKFEIKNILYDLAKWDLREESIEELDKLVDFLTVNDNIKVELSSHTDSRASRSYNQRLSQKRAQSCVDYLIEKGIDKSRIIAKGYGESQLLNECKDGVKCSEEEHQRNRRTEIKILSVD